MISREQAQCDLSASFTVTLTLKVSDAERLWVAAAERALASPGMTLSDVLDTIGPREDPSIADCLAMLTAPAELPGCLLGDFTVRDALIPASVPAELVPMPERPLALALLPAANG